MRTLEKYLYMAEVSKRFSTKSESYNNQLNLTTLLLILAPAPVIHMVSRILLARCGLIA